MNLGDLQKPVLDGLEFRLVIRWQLHGISLEPSVIQGNVRNEISQVAKFRSE
jgi:hypothetical protein